MRQYLLDADAIIDYIAGFPTTVAFIWALRASGVLTTCAVALAEVYSGLHVRDTTKALPLLTSLTFLPTSPEASRQAGEWRYAFARRGIALATTDCLIAATAHDQQAELVTGNLRHFPMQGPIILPLPRSAH
jgi:tRNA(fMet)-specific endonuclease VapC